MNMQIIFYAVIIPVAVAWCAYLAWDAVRECRKIDAKRSARLLSHSPCLEAR